MTLITYWAGAPEQPFNTGVSVITPDAGAEPGLVATKEGTMPTPEGGRPIPWFEFDQLTFTPEGFAFGLNGGITDPSVTVVSGLAVVVGVGLTVIVRLTVGSAHWPLAVVKVYTPDVVLLTTEGLQLPVMPLVDVDGKTGTAFPWQMVWVRAKVNVGVRIGLTVTVKVTGLIH
jgi:hypothetical protein